MHIEQRHRELNWSDQDAFSQTGWALLAACGVTAALLVCWSSSQRHLQRSIERLPRVVELERVFITAARVEAAIGRGLTASAPSSRLVVR